MSSVKINMSSKPTLYYMWESPPCRTVLSVVRLLDLDVNLKTVDLSKKEQMKKEFIKINPFHTVPTLVDTDGFTVWESRAISSYLIETRKPDSPLYPSKDLKKRISIDKMLQYDMGTFTRAISDVVYEVFNSGRINSDKLPRLEEVLKTFDQFLSSNQEGSGPFVAGTQLTVADISMHFNWALLDLVNHAQIDQSQYAAIQAWDKQVISALAPINKDGKFDEAHQNLKTFAQMMIEASKARAGGAKK